MAEIREFRPEALVTFDGLGGLTGHPDHVRTHRVTVLATEAAGLAHRSEVDRGALPGLIARLSPVDREELLSTEWFIRRPLA